jgi:hypothetical protein
VGQVNGYRLFEICTLGEGRVAAAHGVLKMRAETNFCFMRTSDFMEMGGFNERFIQLGGGLANFDFFSRVNHSEVPRLFSARTPKTKSSVRACEKKQYGVSAAGGMMTHAREVWHD